MDRALYGFLRKVERALWPLEAGERADILREIQSQILELQRSGKTTEEILARLGEPKALAAAYTGENPSGFPAAGWKRGLKLAAYYAGGIFVVPCAGLLGGALMVSGVISPVAGLIKLAGCLLRFQVPFIMFQIGSYTAPAPVAAVLSVLLGGGFLLAGRWLWRGMLRYIRAARRCARGEPGA